MGLIPLNELSGLGQPGACGPKPELESGELSKCCPDIGWVIYDAMESEAGLCARASGEEDAGPAIDTGPLPTDPMARVDEMRRRLEQRRESMEEKTHQQKIKEIKLRFSIQRAKRAKAERESATLASKTSALEKESIARALKRGEFRSGKYVRRASSRKKLVAGVAIAAIAAKLLFF